MLIVRSPIVRYTAIAGLLIAVGIVLYLFFQGPAVAPVAQPQMPLTPSPVPATHPLPTAR